MRLLHTIVDRTGFRHPPSNADRLVLLDRLIHLTKQNNAELLVLPAGFLTVHKWKQLKKMVSIINQKGIRSNVAIVGGIDMAQMHNKKPKANKTVLRNLGLPYWGFVAGNAQGAPALPHIWRQTSTSRANAHQVAPKNRPSSERVVVVNGLKFAVLICGELFSEYARRSLMGLRPRLVIDIGHVSMSRVIFTMIKLATVGSCAVAHAQHLVSPYGKLQFVDDTGNKHSISAMQNGLIKVKNLWAGWAVRDVK